MRVLDMIGSDADHYQCPRCGSNDRERHLFLFMRAEGLFERMATMAVLHFAPERRLAEHIRSSGASSYVRCDLFPASPDIVRADITAMEFADDSFDLVIASHVLEHVGDARKALGEIRRVLKTGGLAILQTPYSGKLLSTWEDAGVDTDEARLEAYGQEDHVRLFGKDIFDIIASAGFTPHVRTHALALSDFDPAVYGVNPAEPFFLFSRS